MKDKLRTFYIRNKLLTISFIGLNVILGILLTIRTRFMLYMFGDMSIEYETFFIVMSAFLLIYWWILDYELTEVSKSEVLSSLKEAGYLDIYFNTLNVTSMLTVIGLVLGIFNGFSPFDIPILNVIEALLVFESLIYYCWLKYHITRFRRKVEAKEYDVACKELVKENNGSAVTIGEVLDRVDEKAKARKLKEKEELNK